MINFEASQLITDYYQIPYPSGGPNNVFKVLKKSKKYYAKFAAFQERHGLEMTEGRGGQYSGVSIKRILRSENILQDLRTTFPGPVGEAVYQYLKVTYQLYLLCTNPEVDENYPNVIKEFRERFLVVRKLLQVSWTLKIHVCLGGCTAIVKFTFLPSLL